MNVFGVTSNNKQWNQRCYLPLQTTGEVQAGIILQWPSAEARVRGRSRAGQPRGEIPSQLYPPQNPSQPPRDGAALRI